MYEGDELYSRFFVSYLGLLDEVSSYSMMINNDNQLETMSSNPSNDQQTVQTSSNDLNPVESPEQSTDTEQKPTDNTNEENEDEFIRITAAHQMLTEAQTFDEKKDYASALHLYRICVDLLLEELMFTEGTDQSRVYLREKCTAIMDRIDLLKNMLDPIPPEQQLQLPAPPPPPPTTTTTTNPPTEELDSLHLS